MMRLSATEVAREFSAVINRVGGGEEIEVIRNGISVAEMRPPSAGHRVSASRWRELMSSLPASDDEFAAEVEGARRRIGPPEGAWPS